MSQHKTYDTDIITLRRIFAASPGSNVPVQSDYVLTTGEYGEAKFINPLSISSIYVRVDYHHFQLLLEILILMVLKKDYQVYQLRFKIQQGQMLRIRLAVFQQSMPTEQQLFHLLQMST